MFIVLMKDDFVVRHSCQKKTHDFHDIIICFQKFVTLNWARKMCIDAKKRRIKLGKKQRFGISLKLARFITTYPFEFSIIILVRWRSAHTHILRKMFKLLTKRKKSNKEKPNCVMSIVDVEQSSQCNVIEMTLAISINIFNTKELQLLYTLLQLNN